MNRNNEDIKKAYQRYVDFLKQDHYKTPSRGLIKIADLTFEERELYIDELTWLKRRYAESKD